MHRVDISNAIFCGEIVFGDFSYEGEKEYGADRILNDIWRGKQKWISNSFL